MQESTRFRELENVVLIPENYTQEIQKNLEAFHSLKMYGSFELEDYFQPHQDIGFLQYKSLDKELIKRLEYQIGKVSEDVYGYACLLIGNTTNVYIKDIENELVTYFKLMHSDSENQFWHAHKINLKYSDYEMVYCIIRKLTKNRLFEDIEEFEKEYTFYKELFNGNEKDFLNCLLYPDRLNGYAPYPKDYNILENYSDLKTRLFERKNIMYPKFRTTFR